MTGLKVMNTIMALIHTVKLFSKMLVTNILHQKYVEIFIKD